MKCTKAELQTLASIQERHHQLEIALVKMMLQPPGGAKWQVELLELLKSHSVCEDLIKLRIRAELLIDPAEAS